MKLGGDSLSDEKWSSRSPTYNFFSFNGIKKNRPINGVYDYIDSPFNPREGQIVYLIIVKYTDGNTFGTRYGNICFQGVYKYSSDAEKVKEAIQSNTYTGEDKYRWTGYFQRLEEVYIIATEVRP